MNTVKASMVVAGLMSAMPMSGSQTPTPLPPEVSPAQRGLHAFKSQGGAAALEAVKSNPNPASSRRAELQVIDRLQEIAYWLANERHERAGEAAHLLKSEREKLRGRMSIAEEADLSAAVARVHELVLGDRASAKAGYEDALRLNPRHADASRRLARLLAAEKLAAEKAAENEALRAEKQSIRPRQ